MYITELNTNSKIVTVTLDYDELCCINNAIYQVSRFDDIEKLQTLFIEVLKSNNK